MANIDAGSRCLLLFLTYWHIKLLAVSCTAACRRRFHVTAPGAIATDKGLCPNKNGQLYEDVELSGSVCNQHLGKLLNT
jgi:hypothetical protein